MSPARAKKPASSKPGPITSLGLPHGSPLPADPAGRRRGSSSAMPEVGIFRNRGTYTHTGFVASGVGYRSARIAEREGRSPSRAGARTHERVDRLRLQYESREFVRSNGLYKGMLNRARSYIVGRGFTLTMMSSSKKYNKLVEKAWKKFWKRPEITGQLSGARTEAMVMDELLTCGETAVIPTSYKDVDRLQLIEAEQIIGQNWSHQGIERDPVTSAPTKFWVSPYDPNTGVPLRGDAKGFAPDKFFYISCPERPSSNRAVPPCQAAFPMLHRINDVCDSEAIAWQMQARVALISNRTSGPMVPSAVGARNQNREDTDGDITRNWVTELDAALIFHGKPGEEVKGMERTAPGSSFSESLTMFFRLLGLPLGLPLELILLDWTKSNYSQSRAVLEQAFISFLDWQDLLIDLFHDRVFEWWILRAIDRGEIPEREDGLEHDWIRPTFPWIDQLMEAQAQGEKVDRGFALHGNVLMSLKTDREDFLPRRKQELIDAIETAQEVFEETGVLPPWEPLAGMKAPTQRFNLKDGDGDGEADDGTNGSGTPAPGAPPAGKKAPPTRQKDRARRPDATKRGAKKTAAKAKAVRA